MTIIPSPKILLVGAGNMAREYAKVLKALKQSFLVVGRSKESALIFEKITGIPAIFGGLKNYLETKFPSGNLVSKAIVATDEEQLGPSARLLIKHGAKSILLEKPGGINLADLVKTKKLSAQTGAKVFIAYNRRFYASTLKAQELIKKDGRVTSFTFDFTELSHLIEKTNKSAAVKREWFLANSSHVIDLAFFLGGKPKKITSYKAGRLSWHPRGSIYSGAGISEHDALFSYHANWTSAGRWEVEVMTAKHKLIFRPLEKLQVQKLGSMTAEETLIDNRIDTEFKPGLYRLVQSFLTNRKNLPTTDEQIENWRYYTLMRQ